jgi:dTDP-4-amino-4,6-dideoxygalactose transaminase
VHTHWVFTLLSERPDDVVRVLGECGFDATRVATLAAIPAPAGRPELEPREARALVARLVYVPLHPGMGARTLARLAGAVRSVEADAAREVGVQFAAPQGG